MTKGRKIRPDRAYAQRYLNRIRAINIHIDQKLDELTVLEAKATKVTSTIGGDRVQTSADDKMADAVIKIIELKESIAGQVNDFVKLKQEAEEVVNQIMEPDLVTIIYGRYFFDKTFKVLSGELDISEQWVYKRHNDALDAVKDILIEKYNGSL